MVRLCKPKGLDSFPGKWVLAGSKKKGRAYGTRTDATRYAHGKSANVVPKREIFFVRYTTEEKKRNYADEARVIASA